MRRRQKPTRTYLRRRRPTKATGPQQLVNELERKVIRKITDAQNALGRLERDLYGLGISPNAVKYADTQLEDAFAAVDDLIVDVSDYLEDLEG